VYEKAPPTTKVLAKLPDIVSVLATLLATPVPPLVAGSVPVTPVESGRPVALVRTRAVGVPSAGVTSVGDVANTAAPVPVSSVSAAARLALDGVARNVATPVPRPDTPVEIGRPVTLVATKAAGVPRPMALPEASRYTPLLDG